MADIALAAVDVAATVFVRNDGGRFHRRHVLAEARRHLALVLRGRPRDPGLDDQIMAAAISTHCLAITEPKTIRGLEAGYRPSAPPSGPCPISQAAAGLRPPRSGASPRHAAGAARRLAGGPPARGGLFE
ncbi:hypothetical protein [Streptomyces misionensis]|uniref:hypothetical protein n=1 Tax=Streptomyces misionensis TaxID=67331 RepID=UPI003694A775